MKRIRSAVASARHGRVRALLGLERGGGGVERGPERLTTGREHACAAVPSRIERREPAARGASADPRRRSRTSPRCTRSRRALRRRFAHAASRSSTSGPSTGVITASAIRGQAASMHRGARIVDLPVESRSSGSSRYPPLSRRAAAPRRAHSARRRSARTRGSPATRDGPQILGRGLVDRACDRRKGVLLARRDRGRRGGPPGAPSPTRSRSRRSRHRPPACCSSS